MADGRTSLDALRRGRPAPAVLARPALAPVAPFLIHETAALPPSMPSLVEQMIPRRKLLLMGCETVLFTGLLFLGTNLWPIGAHNLWDISWSPEVLRGLLTSFTIAVICQTSLSYNDLYDWRTAQNRAELPNRLLHACGYSLVMLALLVLLFPKLFYFPGLDVSGQTWKLILL